jgi:DNA polymerase-3 subunit alpha
VIDESVLRGEEFEKGPLLLHEKQMLGQFVTDHPLLEVADRLEAQTDRQIVDLPSLGDGDVVRIGGIVTTAARRFSRKGEPYVVFRLEDLAGGVQIVGFPSVYEQASDLIAPDRIVLVRGRIDLRGRELQVVAADVRELDERAAVPAPTPDQRSAAQGPGAPGSNGSDPLLLSVPTAECTNGLVSQLKQTLASHPGETAVVLRLESEDRSKTLRLSEGYRVEPSAGLLAELRSLLGANGVTRD